MSTSPCPVPVSTRKMTEPHALDSRTPLLFLPVHVETRFIDRPDGRSELWVRIFPDQITINAHEPGLTSQEIVDGQAYWNAVWAAGAVSPVVTPPGCTRPLASGSLSSPPDTLLTPWKNLASKYGAPRAAWIACQLTPTNLTQQPPTAAPTASLTLNFGQEKMIFTCAQPGSEGNQVQVAVDTTSLRDKAVVVNGDLVTIYAKWDGTLHTPDDISRFFPTTPTDDGGVISVTLSGSPQLLSARPPTNFSGGQDPTPSPAFPSPPTRSSSWEQPAIADALPDSWTVVLISGTQQMSYASKTPIQPDLAVTLTPGSGAFPPGSPVDSGLQWLVDFDAAMAAGMALQIPISSQQRSNGFDRMFVFGLRSREENGSATLQGLLDAHHYTDGFALVPQGLPTNNTADASSAYSRKDPDYAISFAVERNGPLVKGPQDEPEVDGNRFASLLGFDAGRMVNVQYSQCTGARNGTDMLAAIWPSTIGYFLNQIMFPVFSQDQIAAARQFALVNTIPRGPIAAFRTGACPYGVLPVTALSRYKLNVDSESTTSEEKLVQLVRQLWPIWLQSSAKSPHMQRTGDPDSQLSQILAMEASSTTFRGRQVFGADFLWNYMGFVGTSPAEKANWWAEQLKPGRSLFDSYGFQSWDPRVIHLNCAQTSFPVSLPTVQAGPLSETDALVADAVIGTDANGKPIAVNYIQWLQQASVSDIRNDNYPGPKPTALLYKILRQSLILEYARLAASVEIQAKRLDPTQMREPELVGMGRLQRQAVAAPIGVTEPPEPVSVWGILDRPADDPYAIKNEKWSDFLVRIAPQSSSSFPELNDLYARMARLALLPTAELDRLLTETLDACSHRLDVWATSIATAILKRARRESNTVHLASYGWVEDLRPESKRAQVQGNELKAVQALDSQRAKIMKKESALPAPLQPKTDNGGFIYAPSQDQAAVAAILRSGYMSHIGTGDEDSLAIDLSSERVRGALMLLDGVRQGQSLNALLGYLFEAGLHELKLDKYIQPFRSRFPMVRNQLAPSDPATETAAVSNVVDGMALKTAWDSGQFNAGQNWPGPGLPGSGQSTDQKGVVTLLERIDGFADALGDLSIAETIFQTVRGNFERGGGLLSAIAKGQRPPDPQVLNTPRGGLDITHRVGLLFAGSPPANVWTNVTPRARALAEPWLDAWLSLVLPDPAKISAVCSVSYVDQASGNKINVSVNLAQLQLGPLDCIAMAEGSTNAPQRSELEYRILYAAGVLPTADPNSITITYQPSSNSSLSFPDVLYLWKNVRLLLNAARPLTPQDFALPTKKFANANGLVDFQGLLARAKAALSALQGDLVFLSDSMPNKSHPDQLPEALRRCSFYGLPGSVPLSNVATDVRLVDQANYVSSALGLGDRAKKAAALINSASATVNDLMSAFGIIFGNEFIALPAFTPPDQASITQAFGQSDALKASDKAGPARWITQLAYVRPAIARLDSALSLADIVGQGISHLQKLWLGQLPLIQNDRWLALPWDSTNPPNKGRVALACFTQGDPTDNVPYSGLMVDEWLDLVPSREERAAVAFHYEEPNARPPQCLLLAVCPDRREFWDDDLVSAVLQEALELAKIRTVDLNSIQQVGQVIPALYFPFNLQGATISTLFYALKESANASAKPS